MPTMTPRTAAGVPVAWVDQVGHVHVYRARTDPPCLLFCGGMTVDGDGSPRCYHPQSFKGLDALSNAGRPGHWWGVATDNGQPDGEPIVQGERDPAPGFYVSTTAHQNPGAPVVSPARYVDAETRRYIVLAHRATFKGCHLGDVALALNLKNGAFCSAMYADVGPQDHLGEGSIAAARALKFDDASPRHGGQAAGIVYAVFPQSQPGWTPPSLWEAEAHDLVVRFGGAAKLKALAHDLFV